MVRDLEVKTPTDACNECQSRLLDYHFGELAGLERKTVMSHLRTCGQCALEYCRLHGDLEYVQEAGNAAPSSEVYERLKTQVQREFPRRTGRSPTRLSWQVVPAALAVALVGLGGSWLLEHTSRPAPTKFLGSSVPVRTMAPAQISEGSRAVILNYDAGNMLKIDPNVL